MRKLVSVITGTYDRPAMVRKCIDTVREQTYDNIEHCIVSDGPDPTLHVWERRGWPEQTVDRNVPIKFIETGRQWSHFLANSISAVPYQVAQWLSSGDYIMWLADDETLTEDHIESLVDLLETKDVDFVYSKTEIYFARQFGNLYKPNVIGAKTPKRGNITQALFRAELLDHCGFMTHVGSGTDWHQISTWMNSGASWAFLDKVTHTHRVDKMGDTGVPETRQELRGWKRYNENQGNNS